MRPPGARLDAAKGETAKALDHFVIAARILGVFVLVVGDGHFDAVVGVVADAAFDVIAVAVEDAGRYSDVLFEDFPHLKLHTEIAVRRVLLGDDDDAAGVAVEPVDDAGPVVAVEVAELGEVETQGVDQRAGPVALGRMHHHVGRLVHDRQIIVLIEDIERDVLRHRRRMGRLRRRDADLVAVTDAVAGLGRLAVDRHAGRFNDALHDGAAQVGKQAGEVLVEAQCRRVGI